MDTARATLYGWSRPRLTAGVLLGTASVCGGALAAYGLAGGEGAPPFVLGAVFAVVALAWGLLALAISVELVVDGAALRWATLLRTGSIPIADIEALRVSRFGPGVIVLEHRQGSVRTLSSLRGADRVGAAIAKHNPDATVDLPGFLEALE